MKKNILFLYNISKTLNSLKIELDDEQYEVHDFNTNSRLEINNAINKFKFDIVIIELSNNLDFVISIIKNIRNKSILTDIITYSHNEKLEDILSLYKNGVTDYIKAPISPKILKAKIHAYAQKYEILNNKYFDNYVKYGDFLVDRDANIIFLNNNPIDTTKKEYRILRVLMKANGMPVSKSDLQKEIWGYVDSNSKTVEATISSLKKKLNNGYIKTIIKKGYFLDKKN